MPDELEIQAQAQADATSQPLNIDQIVEKWFDERIRGSAVARNTEAWNLVMNEKDEQKRRLNEALRR